MLVDGQGVVGPIHRRHPRERILKLVLVQRPLVSEWVLAEVEPFVIADDGRVLKRSDGIRVCRSKDFY